MTRNRFLGTALGERTAGTRGSKDMHKAAFAPPESQTRARASGNGRPDLREVKRLYNREYMRRWRSDPRNRLRNLEDRMRWYYERKLRDALRPEPDPAAHHHKRGCGFCHRRPAVRQIMRLQVSNGPLEPFIEVRVPYCGVC
jgi:hypothetical protein